MKPIHPFPARMAPDLAREKFISLPEGSRILDPMCGSGTSLKYAIDAGHKAVGWDVDPLSVKMARTWCRRYNLKRLKAQSKELELKLKRQRVLPEDRFSKCAETQEFVNYWFEEKQSTELNRLSIAIENMFSQGRTKDFFQIAMSRIIITKFKGASLAWDISHSRPHKKKVNNDFQVIPEFFKSVDKLLQLVEKYPSRYDASVKLRDCRKVSLEEKFDFIITSPPYLNAIDYMRGHKFSLIWMGYTIPELKEVRRGSIGVERGMNGLYENDKYQIIIKNICKGRVLNNRVKNYLFRYIYDCENIVKRMKDILKPKGSMILVVGNSMQYGTRILNDKIFIDLSKDAGLIIQDKKKRSISRSTRYLPISSNDKSISNRMKTETILQFVNA